MALTSLNTGLFFCLFIQFSVILCDLTERNFDSHEEEEFDVKPGSQAQNFGVSLGDVTCKVSYMCMGGSNEKWKMILLYDTMESKSGEYVCSIQRLRGGNSYLYWVEWKLELEGALSGKQFVALGDDDIPLGDDEYTTQKKNPVSFQHSGSFKNKLSKVQVLAAPRKLKKKKEL